MLKLGKKGIVLFVVLMTVVMVIILGTIVLGVMLSQNRFSHHKVSRIQAYYASLAGIRYVSEMLRQRDLNPATTTACSPAATCSAWVPSDSGSPTGTGTNSVCAVLCRSSSCTTSSFVTSNCSSPIGGAAIVDSRLPGSINAVVIIIGESFSSPDQKTRSIKASVDYTATL